jgi:hypothetical protein
MKKNTYFSLILLLLAMALTSLYKLYLADAQMGYDEFLFSGRFAKDLLDGREILLHAFRINAYQDTIKWIGILAVPFFVFLGDAFISLYCVYLLLTNLSLIVLYYLARKFFDHITAAVAVFLYATIPTFIMFSTRVRPGIEYGVGGHGEVALFALITFTLFFSIVYPDKERAFFLGAQNIGDKRSLLVKLIILGLINGISISIIYSNLGAILIVLFIWFYIDPKLYKRPYIYFYVFGFLLGMLPLIKFTIASAGESYIFDLRHLAIRKPLHTVFFSKPVDSIFITLFLFVYKLSLFAQTPYWAHKYLPVHFLGILLLIYGLVLFFRAIRVLLERDLFSRAGRETIIFMYCLLFSILYILFPKIKPDTIYFMTIYPFIFLLIGSLCSRLWTSRYKNISFRSLAIVILILFGMTGIRNAFSLNEFRAFGFGHVPDLFTAKAYSSNREVLIPNHSIKSSFMTTDYWESIVISVEHNRIPKLDEAIAYYPYKYDIYKDYSIFERYDDAARSIIYRTLGMVYMDGQDTETIKHVPQRINSSIESHYRHFFYQGMALSFGRRFFKEVDTAFKTGFIQSKIPPQFLHYFYIEYGRRLALRNKKSPLIGMNTAMSFLKSDINKPYRKYDAYLLYGLWARYEEVINSQRVEKDIQTYSVELQRLYYYFRGIYINHGKLREAKKSNSFDDLFPHPFRVYAIMGIACETTLLATNDYGSYTFDNQILKEKLIFTKEEYANAYYYGLGFFAALRNSDKKIPIDEMYLPEKYRVIFVEGYGLGLAFKYGNDSDFIYSQMLELVSPEYAQALRNGIKHIDRFIKKERGNA